MDPVAIVLFLFPLASAVMIIVCEFLAKYTHVFGTAREDDRSHNDDYPYR